MRDLGPKDGELDPKKGRSLDPKKWGIVSPKKKGFGPEIWGNPKNGGVIGELGGVMGGGGLGVLYEVGGALGGV